MKPIIETLHLGKKYRYGQRQRYGALRDVIGDSFKEIFSSKKDARNDFWALQDINLSVQQGERIGIIGKNGAGKSTLLKILSSIVPPTTGSAIVRGSLSSLLEVGTGFHPELSGRDNIYFNGAVLGLKKEEIRRRFDAIVAFSGVEAFLDNPLKNYSSGMELRLAFAVAAHLEPDVLLIDEVLAVGDLEFQKKCMEKMDEVSRSSGKTILFVSHNLAAIKQLCNTAILIEKGVITRTGSSAEIVQQYMKTTFESTLSSYHHHPGSTISKSVFFTSVSASDSNGTEKPVFMPDEEVLINIAVENNALYRFFSVGIAVNDPTDRRVITDELQVSCEADVPRLQISLSIPSNLLAPGLFTVDLSIERKGLEVTDFLKNAIRFEITKAGTRFEAINYDYGVINIPPAKPEALH